MTLFLVLTGSRELQPYHLPLVQKCLDRAVSEIAHGRFSEVVLVLGDARGLDTLATKLDRVGLLPVSQRIIKYADWDAHGKAAGMLRNKDMVHLATSLAMDLQGESLCAGFTVRELPCKGTRNCMGIGAKELSLGALEFELGILEGITEEFMSKTHTDELIRLVMIAAKGAHNGD